MKTTYLDEKISHLSRELYNAEHGYTSKARKAALKAHLARYLAQRECARKFFAGERRAAEELLKW